jgi:Protein of unknown function (DUF2934)
VTDDFIHETAKHEARIRERAYHLWEADGRPHGRADEYWERARELTAMEDNPDAGQLPNPMTLNEPIPGVTVEEAEIAENYGEIPGRLTDQGDRAQVPAAKKAKRSAGGATPRGKGG